MLGAKILLQEWVELRKKQEWDCRMCCVIGISLGFVLVFHSVFVSCLLQKWEELDLEAGRSWVNSSASQKLLFIQGTALQEQQEWDSDPALAVFWGRGGSSGVKGSICSSHLPLALILPMEKPKCVGKQRRDGICASHSKPPQTCT